MSKDLQETEHGPPRRFKVDPHRGIAKVIGDEVRRHGVCRLSRSEIMRRASIGKTATDRWMQGLMQHGMIKVEGREQGYTPNVITITSRTWLDALGLQ